MAERHISVQRQVPASRAAVWAVLADFPNLADHWDGLRGSRAVGQQVHGSVLGAKWT